MSSSFARAGLSFVVVLLSASCTRSARMVEAPKSVARSERVTDANIAAIVVAANNADIAYANMALNKAVSAEVKAFAQRVIADHSRANTAATDLVTKLAITPVETSISLDVRDKSEVIRDRLRENDGVAFDRAYIDNEIEYHEGMIKLFDETLLPSATNAEMRELLRATRPAVQGHLDHAKRLRPSLR